MSWWAFRSQTRASTETRAPVTSPRVSTRYSAPVPRHWSATSTVDGSREPVGECAGSAITKRPGDSRSGRAFHLGIVGRAVALDRKGDHGREGEGLGRFKPVQADRREHPLDVVGVVEAGLMEGGAADSRGASRAGGPAGPRTRRGGGGR